jgi:hypothetical protein
MSDDEASRPEEVTLAIDERRLCRLEMVSPEDMNDVEIARMSQLLQYIGITLKVENLDRPPEDILEDADARIQVHRGNGDADALDTGT